MAIGICAIQRPTTITRQQWYDDDQRRLRPEIRSAGERRRDGGAWRARARSLRRHRAWSRYACIENMQTWWSPLVVVGRRRQGSAQINDSIVHLPDAYMRRFVDERDSGMLILTHIYLVIVEWISFSLPHDSLVIDQFNPIRSSVYVTHRLCVLLRRRSCWAVRCRSGSMPVLTPRSLWSNKTNCVWRQ
jgi:hypothetical protein